jgi:hypothetical protein
MSRESGSDFEMTYDAAFLNPFRIMTHGVRVIFLEVTSRLPSSAHPRHREVLTEIEVPADDAVLGNAHDAVVEDLAR